MTKNYREDVVNLFLISANEKCDIKPNDYMKGYQSVSEIRHILNSNNFFTAVITAIEEFPQVPDDPAVKAVYELNTQLKEYVSRIDQLVDLSQYTWYEFLMNLDTKIKTKKDVEQNIKETKDEETKLKPAKSKTIDFSLIRKRESFQESIIDLAELVAILIFILVYTWIVHH